MDFAPVAGIVVICAFAGKVLKESPLSSKWIPLICGAVGAAMGIIGMYFVPDFPAGNVIDSLALGITSGLASTGAHQVVKQQVDNKKGEDLHE